MSIVLHKLVNDRPGCIGGLRMGIVKIEHSLRHFPVAKPEDLIKKDFYYFNMKYCTE